MTATNVSLEKCLHDGLAAVGLSLWGFEHKEGVLCVFIDSPSGQVSIDDCGRASRQLSAVLDVEDPIKGKYNLEVSSPGTNRQLFTSAQCQQYIGEAVKLRLRQARDGQRNFKAVISAVEGDTVQFTVDDEKLQCEFSDIDKIRLVGLTSDKHGA